MIASIGSGNGDGYDIAYLATQIEASIVTGAQIAETEWLRALAKHGRFGRLTIYANAGASQRAAFGEALGLDRDTRIDIVAARELPSRIADATPDVFQLPYLFASQIAYLRERFSPRPFPITGLVHAIADPDTKPLLARNLAFASHRSDVAICPSTQVRTALLSISEEIRCEYGGSIPSGLPRTAIIPLGIDTGRFRAGDPHALRIANGIDPQTILISYIGRLSPWTKADLLPLLVGFQRLCAELPMQHLTLLIAGQEQAEGYASLLMVAAQSLGIADRVELWAGVPTDEIAAIYKMSDIFVSPSDNLQETFGMTLIEAMACGVPVIASAWNGYRDIVEDGATGFLIPTYAAGVDPDIADAVLFQGYRTMAAHTAQTTAMDLNVLVDRLGRLAGSAEMRSAQGARAAAVARARYDWKAVIEAHEQLWHEERLANRSIEQTTGYQPFRTDMARHFRHYASDEFDDATALRLCASDRHLPAAVLSRFAGMASIDWSLAGRLLARLAFGPATLQMLQAGEPNALMIRRAVLFLFKHGVIEIDHDTK